MTQKNETQPDAPPLHDVALFLILLSKREVFEKYVDRFDLERMASGSDIFAPLIRRAVKAWREVQRWMNWRQLLAEAKPANHPDWTAELENQERIYITGRSAEDLMAEADRGFNKMQLREWISKAAERFKKQEPMALATELRQELEAITKAESGRTLDTINLSLVDREELTWFWKDRIPEGKLTIIVGNAGVGKSWFSLWMAARVTRGESWPDCPSYQTGKGRVLILANEDVVSDTIVPRIQDCGAAN